MPTTSTSQTKIAVLVSGNGTNLQVIIDNIESGLLDAEIVCVISNVADAFALTRASRHGIPGIIHTNTGFGSRKDYDKATVEILRNYRVDLVVLAGFMRILTSEMVEAYPNAIMNIHPALLPAFPGLHAQQQAIDCGVKYSGCTVHFVDCGTDTGPIIMQAVVRVMPDDTETTLSARIQKEEHRLFSEAIRLFCLGKLSVSGRIVQISS